MTRRFHISHHNSSGVPNMRVRSKASREGAKPLPRLEAYARDPDTGRLLAISYGLTRSNLRTAVSSAIVELERLTRERYPLNIAQVCRRLRINATTELTDVA